MRFIFIVLLLFLFIVGCAPLSPAYYQPLPSEYEMWSKPENTTLDIKKALLECGMNNPFGSSDSKSKPYSRNYYYNSRFCMESQGYIDDFGMTVREACKLYPETPACQPGAVIPKPSVERRLNSEYCQKAREMVNEDSYQRCLSEDAVKYKRVTEKDCVYWYRKLVEECLP